MHSMILQVVERCRPVAMMQLVALCQLRHAMVHRKCRKAAGAARGGRMESRDGRDDGCHRKRVTGSVELGAQRRSCGDCVQQDAAGYP